ncbi:MAG: phosphoenolpyruvate synthase [Candidatus Bathyarchaeia archaeon]|jgi:pyruvate,water dikinase
MSEYIVWFENLSIKDVPEVGGKNASLGEMIGQLRKDGILIPDGFATTSKLYWDFVEKNNLKNRIESLLRELADEQKPLKQVGATIRSLFVDASFPEDMAQEITNAYSKLCERYGKEEVDVAVRSSATAEDLPGASFAGQQETFLNVKGNQQLLESCKKCFASLFTDRAITYRKEQGFQHMKIALSCGIQKMVRSDKAGSGVMFTLDTETGFPKTIIINAGWGLGEYIVKGEINPDRYVIFKTPLNDEGKTPILEKVIGDKAKKLVYSEEAMETTRNLETSQEERDAFVLTDKEMLQLSCWGLKIEQHYKRPMDIEWAKDGESGELFIVQARPETVQSRIQETSAVMSYDLKEKGKELVTGQSIGQAIATGKVNKILDVKDIDKFRKGDILVTKMTDPDWVTIMKQASGIITDYGGRTSHAAIVSRELGIPAIVGTEKATQILNSDQEITLSCAEGETGYVYEGILKFEKSTVDIKDIPKTKTQIMMNMASPDAAFRWWRLPCEGIGLARMEFIINNIIKIHPMALVKFDSLKDNEVVSRINELTKGYKDKTEYFVDNLAKGIARLAAAQYPYPVIVRMSDFKTNEYANLIGGKTFEPKEDNPMLGFRGASRYYSDRYKEGFALECQAVKRAREVIGLTNILVMIPFCRTVEEAEKVIQVMAENGLERGKDGLEVYVMAEIPSNIILADKFAEFFDGFSIGSNDLTQLVLGIDRDSAELAYLFDERNEAVKKSIRNLIVTAHGQRQRRKVGICGQAPSDYPDFAAFLVQQGIDSISVNPDSVINVRKRVAEEEKKINRKLAEHLANLEVEPPFLMGQPVD